MATLQSSKFQSEVAKLKHDVEEYAKQFQEEMKAAGIEATHEEIVNFLTPDETVELSKDELDNVAGGGCFHSDEEYKRNGCKMPCSNYC